MIKKLDIILEKRHWLLYSAVFTLPMYMRLNNYLLGIFIAVSLLVALFNARKGLKDAFRIGWPSHIFFVLAIAGAFYGTTFLGGVKLLERYWAFLVVPLAILSDKELYREKRDGVFLSLAWGCAATLILCYGNLLYEMIARNEPITYFFRWRHIGHQFTEVADTHPTYLGLFIVVSIVFLFRHKINTDIKYPLMVFLLFGLFQLASRMALFLTIAFLVILVVMNVKKQWGQLLLLVLGITAGVVIFNRMGSKYVKDRLFSIEAIKNDKRFQRWEASYEIFKENPFFGVGFANIESVRDEKYIKYGFEIAARKDLNAHNQLLEYLSRNGVIGGFVYVCTLVYLLLVSVYRRDFLFTFVFFVFILANLTESMMVRIKGIEFFAIFTALFLCGYIVKNTGEQKIIA